MDNDFYHFLMFELSEVVENFDSDSKRADEVMVILSAAEGEIPETFYRMYTESLPMDQDTIKRALAFYSGIGEVKVTCDCAPEDMNLCDIYSLENDAYFEYGKESVGSTREWYNARMRVRELQADLRS